MPDVNQYDDKNEWMKVCVPKMMGEGKTNEEAVGACMGMWANKEDAAKYKALFYSIKAIDGGDDWRLEILGVPFGGPIDGKDLQGEKFDEKTQIHQDFYKEIPVNYFHGLDPITGQPTGDPTYIGKAKYLRKDHRGHWYEAILDKTKEFAKKVWEAAKKGMAAASSESINHLVRTEKDGRITNWPVAGMAVLDVSEGRHPVNSFAVAVPLMKAIYEEAGIPFPVINSENDEPKAEEKAAKIARKNLQKQARQLISTFDEE